MKIKTLFLAASFVSVITPAYAVAAEMKATDLVGVAGKGSAAVESGEMMQAFSGPVELLNAAKAGDTAAQLEIAILYEYGFNMPDNEVYALAWYLLAAEDSAKAASHRDKLLNKLSPAQVDKARRISKTLVTAPPKTPPPPAEAPMETPAAMPPAEIAPIPENQ